MALGLHRSPEYEPILPQNTVVVLPKAPASSKSALWLLFWAVGIAMGLLARDVLDGPSAPVPPTANAEAAGVGGAGGISGLAPAPTLAVQVLAVLELPTDTPTVAPTVTATIPPVTPFSNVCGDAKPGAICQVPPPPDPTPTPYPSCADMTQLAPGDWCRWPDPPAVASPW